MNGPSDLQPRAPVASGSAVLLDGWVEKKSRWVGRWRMRFLVFYREPFTGLPVLLTFRCAALITTTERIDPVRACACGPTRGLQHGFRVYSQSGDSVLFLTSTPDESEAWVRAILHAVSQQPGGQLAVDNGLMQPVLMDSGHHRCAASAVGSCSVPKCDDPGSNTASLTLSSSTLLSSTSSSAHLAERMESSASYSSDNGSDDADDDDTFEQWKAMDNGGFCRVSTGLHSETELERRSKPAIHWHKSRRRLRIILAMRSHRNPSSPSASKKMAIRRNSRSFTTGVNVFAQSDTGTGIRQAFSETTAIWLANVAASPQHADLSHLTDLCHDGTHPFGALTHSFKHHFEDLHGTCSEMLEGISCAAAMRLVHAAVATFRTGAAQLLDLILDVLQVRCVSNGTTLPCKRLPLYSPHDSYDPLRAAATSHATASSTCQ